MIRRKGVALAAAALVIGFLVLHVARLPEPLGVDQGLFACFTRWVPRGWLPYRDLFDSKPPLFLYWWGLARVVPGELPRAIWWFEAIWLSLTIAVCYALAARLWGKVAGLAASTLLVVGLWSPSFGGFWSRAQAEEVLALPMLLSAWLSLRALEREKLAFSCGVLAGVCGLFKIPSMAIVAAWALTFVVALGVAPAVRRIALLLAGVATPWLVAWGWFAAHGESSRFFEGVFVYHRYNAAFIAPPWGFVLDGFVSSVQDGALLPLVASAIAMLLFLRRGALEMTWLGAWILLTMAAVVLQRQLAGYHFLLFAPALAMAGGYGVAVVVRALSSHGRPRVLAVVVALLLAYVGARTVGRFVDAYGPGFALVQGKLDRAHYLARIQQGTYSNATEEQAARYVAEHSTKEQGIFVWGLSPGIYALADRHPTTRFPFHKLLYTDAPLSRMIPGLAGRRAELLERLRRDPPIYVLVGSEDRNAFEPLDSQTSLRQFAELRELVERAYTFETRIGRFDLLRRRL